MRKGSAFPRDPSLISREAAPGDGGKASNKSKVANEKTTGKLLPPPARDIADFERDEFMAAFREVFSANGELDRDTTSARSLALWASTAPARASTSASATCFRLQPSAAFSTKQITVSRYCQTINDYRRDDLIDALLNAMGRAWWEREDATRAAARHLGFRRTGTQIRDAFKSAINGAIRRGLLEYNAESIRKAK